eukprot:2939675-Prorocentrum_lima.AAC.1
MAVQIPSCLRIPGRQLGVHRCSVGRPSAVMCCGRVRFVLGSSIGGRRYRQSFRVAGCCGECGCCYLWIVLVRMCASMWVA